MLRTTGASHYHKPCNLRICIQVFSERLALFQSPGCVQSTWKKKITNQGFGTLATECQKAKNIAGTKIKPNAVSLLLNN